MGTGNLGQWADTILTGLFVVSGAIMIFFILLQEGKGGGLAALGGTKAAGVEGVTNPIRRATVYVAILFFILASILGILHKPKASLGVGPGSSSTTSAPGASAAPSETKKNEEAKPAETKPAEAKPAEGAKTDAAKPAEKTAEGAKVEEKKPAGEIKAEDKKPAETPKTEEKKPADAPKADDTKKDAPAK